MVKIPHEKRRYPRIEAKVKVGFKTLDDVVSGYTENISGGGLFLKTNRLVDPNAELDLTVVLEEPQREYRVRGRVVRLMSLSDPQRAGEMIYGLGIQFVGIDAEFSQLLQEAIAQSRRV